MRTLPTVTSLRSALEAVIKSNKADKYPPNRFVQIVANTEDSELIRVCTELICSKSAFSQMSNALLKQPTLLTLEDFVARFGLDWGFSEEAVANAKLRSESFDCLVNTKRYE